MAIEHTNLRHFRKHLSLTQTAFATQLGMKQGSYSDIERGKVGISAELIKTLIVQYKLNPLWLYTGKGEMIADYQAKPSPKVQQLLSQIDLLKTRIEGLEREKKLLEKMVNVLEQAQR